MGLESELGMALNVLKGAGEEGAGMWGRKKAKGTSRSRGGRKGRKADLGHLTRRLVHDNLEMLMTDSPETLGNRVKWPLGSLGLHQQGADDTGGRNTCFLGQFLNSGS